MYRMMGFLRLLRQFLFEAFEMSYEAFVGMDDSSPRLDKVKGLIVGVAFVLHEVG